MFYDHLADFLQSFTFFLAEMGIGKFALQCSLAWVCNLWSKNIASQRREIRQWVNWYLELISFVSSLSRSLGNFFACSTDVHQNNIIKEKISTLLMLPLIRFTLIESFSHFFFSLYISGGKFNLQLFSQRSMVCRSIFSISLNH